MIRLKDNGDIDEKALTKQELETIAQMKLDYHKREQDELFKNIEPENE